MINIHMPFTIHLHKVVIVLMHIAHVSNISITINAQTDLTELGEIPK